MICGNRVFRDALKFKIGAVILEMGKSPNVMRYQIAKNSKDFHHITEKE